MFKNKLLCVGFALIFICGASFAQADKKLAQDIDQLLQKEYPATSPGAAVIVQKQGRVIVRKGYGMANLELGVATAPDMVYRLGSITKQFTAVAILMLAEQGKLKVEDDLHTYLPDFPTQGKHITIEHLLTHTSGIKSYTNLPEWLKLWRKDMSVAEIIDLFKTQPLEFEPGTKWNYSNSGYILLGAIIEKASGMSYEDYIQTKIFTPLGMTHSCYGNTERVIMRRVPGYDPAEKGFINTQYLSMTQPYAAGSLLSSVDDMATWNAALAAGKLIKTENLKRAQTPYHLVSGEPCGYGYGWMPSEYEGHAVIEHGGGINGFLTHELSILDEHVYVAILHNCGDKQPGQIAFQIAAMAIGKPLRKPKTITLPAAKLQALCGVFEHAPGDDREITFANGHLYSQRGGGQRYEILPVSETDFVFTDSDTRLTFVKNEQGLAVEVIAKNRLGGADQHAKKVARAAATHQEIKLDPATFDRYLGEYELAPGMTLTILKEGERLMALATGQGKVEIIPESETQFFLKVVNAQLEFKMGADGKAESMVLHQAGQHIPAKKIKK